MLNTLLLLAAYAVLAFGTLGVLGWMIIRIGALVGDCPASDARARAASLTIATGYLAIGAGGVVLGGAVAVFVELNLAATIAVLGFIVLCLGLGFSNAISTLRAVVVTPVVPDTDDVPSVPLDPVPE